MNLFVWLAIMQQPNILNQLDALNTTRWLFRYKIGKCDPEYPLKFI